MKNNQSIVVLLVITLTGVGLLIASVDSGQLLPLLLLLLGISLSSFGLAELLGWKYFPGVFYRTWFRWYYWTNNPWYSIKFKEKMDLTEQNYLKHKNRNTRTIGAILLSFGILILSYLLFSGSLK